MKKSSNQLLKILIISYVIAFFLILIGFSYIEYLTSTPKSLTFKLTGAEDEVADSDFVATVANTKSWRESALLYGIQYDVTLLNNTKFELHDWNVQIALPKHAKISDSWEWIMKSRANISPLKALTIMNLFSHTMFVPLVLLFSVLLIRSLPM